MFLPWTAKCDLVPTSAESYVLKKFSEKCQRTLCTMVISFLNTDGIDLSDVLPTEHHIRWSMEIIGHAFALHLDDADVIVGAIRIYEKWLGVDGKGSSDSRPKCMTSVEQDFIQDILGHLSLIFEDRNDSTRSSSEITHKHVQLCSRVLDMFESVAKRRGRFLSPSTWDRMIRLLLGATDGILHSTRHVLGSPLCGTIVRILMECYLQSLIYCGPRGELWNLIQKFYRRWTHRIVVIEQWNAVTFALTKCLLRHLQRKQITSKVSLEIVWFDRLQSTMEMDISFVTYAWYRMLRVVGHPSSFVDPEVYHAAIKGISRLMEEMTRIEQNPAVRWDQVLEALNSTLHEDTYLHPHSKMQKVKQRVRAPPDVNTILRLLGPWLFDASISRSSRFAACRSEALRCLGKLICVFSNGRSKRIHWAYSMRSLVALQMALLEEDDDRVVASAVLTWSKVFGLYGNHTLRGVAVITGPFHRAVERVLRACERTVDDSMINGIPIVLLRRACIEACTSLLSLHTHQPRHLIKQAERLLVEPSMHGIPGLLSTLPKYTSSHVVAILVNTLKIETDSTNQQMLLWMLMVAIQQEAAYWLDGMAATRNTQLPLTILMMSTVITKAGRYKAPVLFTCFECLRHLSLVGDELFTHASSTVVHLVNSCCDFVIASSSGRSSRAPYFAELLDVAYQCITEWVVAAPMLLSKPQVLAKVISTVINQTDRSSRTHHSKRSNIPIRSPSDKLLNMLMKHHAAPLDADACALNEHTAWTQLCGQKIHKSQDIMSHCRFFSINKKALLTVIEKPPTQTSSSPETILIMRDSSGRYVWRIKPRVCAGSRPKSLSEYEAYTEEFNIRSPDREAMNEGMDARASSEDANVVQTIRDPLLNALRATSQSSNLTSWQAHDPVSRNTASNVSTVNIGEGNTGFSSANERKAASIGREAREMRDSVFTDLLTMQSELDRDVRNKRPSSKLFHCRAPDPPIKDPALQSWEISRRMMTELGFLSVRNWGSVFAMKVGSAKNDTTLDILSELEHLDKIPTRETFEFAIAYVESRGSKGGFDMVHLASSIDVATGATKLSPSYELFLTGLGTRTALGGESSIGASLDATYHFDGDVVHYSSFGGEVCFYVPTFPMSNRQDGSIADPLRLLDHASVLVVWNESQLNYRPGSVLWDTTFALPTPSSHVILLIDPLGNDLYCVRISHEGSPLFKQRDQITREDEQYVDEGEVHCARVLGPLQDGMVVNGAWLAPLVRQTAINAAKIARAFHRHQYSIGATKMVPPDEPEVHRDRMIAKLMNKYIYPQLPGEFYGGLFTDLKEYANDSSAVDNKSPTSSPRYAHHEAFAPSMFFELDPSLQENKLEDGNNSRQSSLNLDMDDDEEDEDVNLDLR